MGTHEEPQEQGLAGGLLLFLSNAMLLPAVVLCLRRGYPVDFALTVMMLIASCLYHACDAGWFCVEDLHQHRIQDHFMCNSILSWFMLTIVGLPPMQRAAVLVVTMSSYVLLADRWLDSMLYPAALALSSVAFAIARYLGMGRRIARFDASDMAIAAVLFVAAYVPYSIVEPDERGAYALMHSMWHFLSMLAIYFTIESRDGVPFYRKVIDWTRRAACWIKGCVSRRNNNEGGEGGQAIVAIYDEEAPLPLRVPRSPRVAAAPLDAREWQRTVGYPRSYRLYSSGHHQPPPSSGRGQYHGRVQASFCAPLPSLPRTPRHPRPP